MNSEDVVEIKSIIFCELGVDGQYLLLKRLADKFGYDVVKYNPELKPCPFCHSDKFGCKLLSGEVGDLGIKYWVECIDECGYQSAYFNTSKEAVSAHNNLIAEK
mgnify:CR=1 FL=1